MSDGSFSRDWDEAVPADHTKFKNQPGYVRNKATDVAERLKSFFSGLTSGETTKGAKHLEFLNQASAPSAVADSLIVHAEDDVAPTPSSELFHTHETYGKQQSTFRGAPILLLSGLTNKDAATLNAGDVVVDNNGSTANSFKGSTTEGDTTVLGILTATKAADATNGAVCHAGEFWVNVKSGDAGGKGSYIMQSDTKGKVKTTSVWQSGVFGELLTDISSDKAIAEIFPVVRFPGFASEAQGDIAYRAASNWARLGAGTAGQFLKTLGSGANPAWSGFNLGVVKRSSGDYTTTSQTFVDVDATNVKITLTTGANRVLIGVVAIIDNDTDTNWAELDIDIDGARQGGSSGLISIDSRSGMTAENGSFTYITDVLTAALHTFKLQFRSGNGSGTVTLRAGTVNKLIFWAIEIPL